MKSRKVYDFKKKKKNGITRIRNTSIVQTIRCSCFYSIAGEDDHQDDHMLTIKFEMKKCIKLEKSRTAAFLSNF